MSTTTIETPRTVIENLFKLPLKAVNTVKLPPASEGENPGQKDVFLLKSTAYFDLLAYLHTGVKLPSSSDAYQRLYPSEQCQKLTDVDHGIYEVTKGTFLSIQNSCQEFEHDHLGYIVQVADKVQTFCDHAISLMEGNKLKGQVAVLLDDKYEDEKHRDKTFDNSRKACNLILGRMQKSSEDTAKEIEQAVSRLIAFKSTTITNAESVSFLKKEYKTGPVLDSLTKEPKLDENKKPFQPYAMYINAEMERLNQEVERDIQLRDDKWKEYIHDVVVASTTVTYWWIPIASVTVAGVFGKRAVDARTAYETLKAKVEENQAEISTLTALSANITGLCIQFDDIGTKIGAALQALIDIESLFREQSKNFGQAAKFFGDANGSIDEEFFYRKLMLQDSIDKAIAAFKKVKKLADDFGKVKFELKTAE